MKHNTNRIKDMSKRLSTLSDDLSFEVDQGWTSSLYHIARYLDEHTYNDECFDDRRSGLMAAGRLSWLLGAARSTLSGVFSEKDIFTLINCYQDIVFSTDQISTIPSYVCEALGIKLDNYEVSCAAPLISKLLNLNALQRLILADTLERIWYQPPMTRTNQIPEVFDLLGIQLR
ncbi:hypothetical protein ACHAC9_08085 [Massilia sp. CMS3.1]|uniref:hypothetical protein n=1 Tax=Massilia sp. CMS3.1 TaxID=3373083 RepID=UPI003EE60941